MRPDSITAEDFFELYNRFHAAEDEMSNQIAAAFGFSWSDETSPCEDISFDPYDSSFELHGVYPAYRANACQCISLSAIGFNHFWLNHSDGGETYYSDCSHGAHVTRKEPVATK